MFEMYLAAALLISIPLGIIALFATVTWFLFQAPAAKEFWRMMALVLAWLWEIMLSDLHHLYARVRLWSLERESKQLTARNKKLLRSIEIHRPFTFQERRGVLGDFDA